jgi:hypothetical protein
MTTSDERAWARGWAEMTDAELQDALNRYLWLAANTANPHAHRIQQLVSECQNRGKPHMVERAQHWVWEYPKPRDS